MMINLVCMKDLDENRPKHDYGVHVISAHHSEEAAYTAMREAIREEIEAHYTEDGVINEKMRDDFLENLNVRRFPETLEDFEEIFNANSEAFRNDYFVTFTDLTA